MKPSARGVVNVNPLTRSSESEKAGKGIRQSWARTLTCLSDSHSRDIARECVAHSRWSDGRGNGALASPVLSGKVSKLRRVPRGGGHAPYKSVEGDCRARQALVGWLLQIGCELRRVPHRLHRAAIGTRARRGILRTSDLSASECHWPSARSPPCEQHHANPPRWGTSPSTSRCPRTCGPSLPPPCPYVPFAHLSLAPCGWI